MMNIVLKYILKISPNLIAKGDTLKAHVMDVC